MIRYTIRGSADHPSSLQKVHKKVENTPSSYKTIVQNANKVYFAIVLNSKNKYLAISHVCT